MLWLGCCSASSCWATSAPEGLIRGRARHPTSPRGAGKEGVLHLPRARPKSGFAPHPFLPLSARGPHGSRFLLSPCVSSSRSRFDGSLRAGIVAPPSPQLRGRLYRLSNGRDDEAPPTIRCSHQTPRRCDGQVRLHRDESQARQSGCSGVCGGMGCDPRRNHAGRSHKGPPLLALAGVTLVVSGTTIAAVMLVGLKLEGTP